MQTCQESPWICTNLGLCGGSSNSSFWTEFDVVVGENRTFVGGKGRICTDHATYGCDFSRSWILDGLSTINMCVLVPPDPLSGGANVV